MRLQFTLTSAQGKRFIAKGISCLSGIKVALRGYKILLKGGTTVSAISEELVGVPLRISGRVTPLGTKTAKYNADATQPHSILVRSGRVTNIDQSWKEAIYDLGRDDYIIVGANVFDVYGNAAMMAGSCCGEQPGIWLHGAWTEGVNVIIAAGMEKLIPWSVRDLILKAGRKRVDKSYGMAVGFVPLFGEIFTEVEAARAMARVECFVIGKGGINGAEGSTTLIVDGNRSEIAKIEKNYLATMESTLSGTANSLLECSGNSGACRRHLRCTYKSVKT